mgnify:CR=1 FL=1
MNLFKDTKGFVHIITLLVIIISLALGLFLFKEKGFNDSIFQSEKTLASTQESLDVGSTAPNSSTNPTPTPTPGATNKRVFVSSQKFNGILGGLTGADNKCQVLATTAKLGGTWKAWLSDSSVSVSSRLTQSTAPYVRLDGKIVANNWTDLTDWQLQNAIEIDEMGRKTSEGVQKSTKTVSSPGAWTGSNASGNIKTPNCNNWTSRSTKVEGIGGDISQVFFGWTDAWITGGNPSFAKCSDSHHLYCFEQ